MACCILPSKEHWQATALSMNIARSYPMSHSFRQCISLLAAFVAIPGIGYGSTLTVTFENLLTPPAFTGYKSMSDANNNSLVYDGITWTSGFSVVGDEYRTGGAPPQPVFGVPHSGHYFVTNQNGGAVTITTSQVLTGAWFGRNEYYGYAGGADQVTIVAVANGIDLASVVFDLPPNIPGNPYEQAAPLSFVDTSAFTSLSGITGYRIDNHAPVAVSDNWVADDFQFTIPLPATVLLLGAALPGFIGFTRRK
jgi:hypothetical protein